MGPAPRPRQPEDNKRLHDEVTAGPSADWSPERITSFGSAVGGALSTRPAVSWQHPASRLIEAVGLLTCDDGGLAFGYLARADLVDGFRPFLGFPDLERRYVSPRLFPTFAQRIMRRGRPDYRCHLETLSLDPGADPRALLLTDAGGVALGWVPHVLLDYVRTTTGMPEPSVVTDEATDHLVPEDIPDEVADEQDALVAAERPADLASGRTKAVPADEVARMLGL